MIKSKLKTGGRQNVAKIRFIRKGMKYLYSFQRAFLEANLSEMVLKIKQAFTRSDTMISEKIGSPKSCKTAIRVSKKNTKKIYRVDEW